MIGKDEFLAELRRVVAGREDYVYPAHNGCKYNEYSDEEIPVAPSCIVGTVIYNLTGKFVPVELEGSLASQLPYFDSEAAKVARVAQVGQDSGATWGEALEAAESVE